MNGKKDRMKLVARQSQLLSSITELAVSLRRPPQDVVPALFLRLDVSCLFYHMLRAVPFRADSGVKYACGCERPDPFASSPARSCSPHHHSVTACVQDCRIWGWQGAARLSCSREVHTTVVRRTCVMSFVAPLLPSVPVFLFLVPFFFFFFFLDGFATQDNDRLVL